MEENKDYETAIDILSEGIKNKAKNPYKSSKNIDASLYYFRACFKTRINDLQSAYIDFYNVIDLHQGEKEKADSKKMCELLRPRV